MKKIAILLLSLMMLSACAMHGAGSSGVTLTAARTGPQVLLTLRNDGPSPAGYNLCTSALQRQSGAAWEPVETGDVCTMEIRTLESGTSATFEKTLPAGLPAGQYRYVTNVHVNENRMVVESNPFAVE